MSPKHVAPTIDNYCTVGTQAEEVAEEQRSSAVRHRGDEFGRQRSCIDHQESERLADHQNCVDFRASPNRLERPMGSSLPRRDYWC